MLISKKSSAQLQEQLQKREEVFCSGLFLSARWMVVSQVAREGVHLILMPTRESAEYCSADLYNMVEGDCVFFLPELGKSVERSNYKSSLGVQRTAAIGKLMDRSFASLRMTDHLQVEESPLFIITYPEAMEEKVPSAQKLQNALFSIKEGQEIAYESIRTRLLDEGFEKVDFVSAPGQFALRGAVIDIFSFSSDKPFRLSFFGDEVEKIHTFDCNTQLSVDRIPQADVYPDIAARETEEGESLVNLLPAGTTVWLDSSDMYRQNDFFVPLLAFKHVYLDIPLQKEDVDKIQFNISPQPVFNKNFDLLIGDIRSRIENK